MSAITLVRRRLAGDFEVDEWGLDPDFVSVLSPLFGLRWSLDVRGAAQLPTQGPGVVVYNRRFGPSAPFVVGRAVRLETGRHLRVAGAPDRMLAGPLLRRLGAVLEQPDEIASLLHAGHLVAVALDRSTGPRRNVGGLDGMVVADACRSGIPVHPVALVGSEHRRRWRVEIGSAISSVWTEGTTGEAEVSDAVRADIGALLAADHRA